MKYYGVRNKDLEVLRNSRSGGFFTEVCKYILERNGVIYGCSINEDMTVSHKRATSWSEASNFRGSKYVQSNLGDTFQQIKHDLEQNLLLVLFSGTACQIAGLQSFLKIEKVNTSNLITVDILCHGVPSPLVYHTYLDYIRRKYGENIVSVNFRDKKRFGWGADLMTIKTRNHRISSFEYYYFFWGGLSQRLSCFNCPFHKVDRKNVDFTLADFWGIENVYPQFADDKGTSMIIVNTTRASQIFEDIKHFILYFEATEEEILQPVLLGNDSIPNIRSEFWRDFNRNPYEIIRKKYRKPKHNYVYAKQKVKQLYYWLFHKM